MLRGFIFISLLIVLLAQSGVSAAIPAQSKSITPLNAAQVADLVERAKAGNTYPRLVGGLMIDVRAVGDVMEIKASETEDHFTSLTGRKVFETTRENYCHDAGYARRGAKVRFIFTSRDGQVWTVQPEECLRLATSGEVERRRADAKSEGDARDAAEQSRVALRTAQNKATAVLLPNPDARAAAALPITPLGRTYTVTRANSVTNGGALPNWYHWVRIPAKAGDRYEMTLVSSGVLVSPPLAADTGAKATASGDRKSGDKTVYTFEFPADGNYIFQIRLMGWACADKTYQSAGCQNVRKTDPEPYTVHLRKAQ